MEKIEKGDNAKAKGGTGYTARRWRTAWVFDCSAKGCRANSEDRDVIERHVLAAHGTAQTEAGDA